MNLSANIPLRMNPTCKCNASTTRRLKQMRVLREKQTRALQSKCGGKSWSVDVIPTKECIAMWNELDETIEIIERLQRKKKSSDELFWFEEENRMYDI